MSAAGLGLGLRKLCHQCSVDASVRGRCGRGTPVEKKGAICDRCLSDGKLLVQYDICCEPENRWGHTKACRESHTVDRSAVLQQVAVLLFGVDIRVLAIVRHVEGKGGFGLRKDLTEAIGKAWDLAGDGHEPEATYRREAENKAFEMGQFKKELSTYMEARKKLTRKSEVTDVPIRVGSGKQVVAGVRKDECGHKPNIPYAKEHCNRSVHLYGWHQYKVDGRVLSQWNAEAYHVASVHHGEIAPEPEEARQGKPFTETGSSITVDPQQLHDMKKAGLISPLDEFRELQKLLEKQETDRRRQLQEEVVYKAQEAARERIAVGLQQASPYIKTGGRLITKIFDE